MFKTWFGGGNAPDLTSKTKVTDRFSSLKTFLARKKAAEENIYTGILTTYGVRWTLEKAARDIWQNFFDYNKTLDCVQTEVKESKEGRVLRISNGATYDYRML
ncbi:hypothetical protein FJZ26_03590, partial [Candidatus Parvarchaeota archaeon]|nr:hypothetical protein [Candidatus Parvarchaeota archaeon]